MTTYYVRRDGRDSNSGLGDSAGQAWHCVEAAVGSLAANDILVVQPGTWRMRHKIAGSDGVWTTSVRYTGTGLGPESATAGDYLYAFAPGTGSYRSYRIAAAGPGYVDLEEPASGSGTPTNRGFWVAAAGDIPQRTIALAGPSGWVSILFQGVDVDADGLTGTLLSLLSGRFVLHGGRFHGTAGTGNGVLVSNSVVAYLHDVEAHDCHRGVYLDSRSATTSLVGCRGHHNRDAGIYVACTYSGYYMGHLFGCRSDHNGGDGFYLVNAILEGCLSDANSEAGYNAPTGHQTLLRCLAGGNARGAVVASTARLFNNVLYGNTVCDLDATGMTARLLAQYNCVGTVVGTTLDDSNFSTDPCFRDAANGDFRLRGNSPCWNAGYALPFLAGNVGHVGPFGIRYRSSRPHPAVYARPRGQM